MKIQCCKIHIICLYVCVSVCIHLLGRLESFPHESAFEAKLGTSFISLQNLTRQSDNVYKQYEAKEKTGLQLAYYQVFLQQV